LLQYPEDLELTSQAAGLKFQVSYLDELANPMMQFNFNRIDLKKWMYPEALLH